MLTTRRTAGLVALFPAFLLVPAVFSADEPATGPEPRVTREATCRRVDEAPVIDGKLDDPAWSEAEVIDRFPGFHRHEDYGLLHFVGRDHK
jgi:hypothetical protein